MIAEASATKPLTKRALAQTQGISLSSLYYQPKQPAKDWHLKNQLEQTLHEHPSYGYRRLALALGINPKRARRVMRLFGLKPYRRRGRRFRKPKDVGIIHQNLLQQLPFPHRPNLAWVSDFTYIPFHSRTVFLATIMDVYNRRVVGWSLLTSHTVQLTLSALITAIEKQGRPQVLHSDQGSEYKSKAYARFALSLGIKLSMSHPGSPWENGYQEAFYSQFKVDLGDPNRFKILGELAVAIYSQIHYYNTQRIHSKLKMPPSIYALRQAVLTTNLVPVTL